MDGFSGFTTAAMEELSEAVIVTDPFHVVRLAADAVDDCRHRIQHDTCGHRGRTDDPLYSARRTPRTGSGLLTEKQQARLNALFANDAHVEVESTWGVHQAMIAAYRQPHGAASRGPRAGRRSRTSLSGWAPSRPRYGRDYA